MEEGEGDEAAAGPHSVLQTGYSEAELNVAYLEQLYVEHRGSFGMDGALEYYRDFVEKTDEDFLKVPTRDLDYFSREFLHESWLPGMLANAVVFYHLHGTWEIYICPMPDCRCWFSEGESLLLHLMRKHFPVIHYCNAWPLPRHDPTEERWCVEALRSMVWKPIDVKRAFDLMSTICLDFTSADAFGSLDWPLSEDVKRTKLLEDLGERFMTLLACEEQSSFSLLSNGRLRAIVAVASEHIQRHFDPEIRIPLPFRTLLDCSPFSFRFVEHEPLSYFVQLVGEMCHLVLQAAEPQTEELDGTTDGDFNCNTSDLDAISSLPADGAVGYYFVLDSATIKLCHGGEGGIASWLLKAPAFPLIKEVPASASKILELVQSKAASFSEWLANAEKCPRIAVGCEVMQYDLERIKSICELQSLEPLVCRLCAVDLRMYIVPLSRSFLRMKLYLYMNMGFGSVAGEVEDKNTDLGPIMASSQQEDFDGEVCSKIKNQHATGEGGDVSTPRIGSGKKSEESFVTPLEFKSSSDTSRNSGTTSEESFYTRLEFRGGSNSDGSSSADSDPALDPVKLDLGKSSGATGGAGIGCRASPSVTVNAALSRNRTNVVRAASESEADPEAKPKSDASPQRQAEPLPDIQPECQAEEESIDEGEFMSFCDLEYFSDSETEAEEESERKPLEMIHPLLRQVDLFMRESRAEESEGIGLFFCMKVTDVMKHCLETSCIHGAESIWAWKTNKALKYWHCSYCAMKFTDKESHMLHMESTHRLGSSLESWFMTSKFWCGRPLMPSRFWQGVEAEKNFDSNESLVNGTQSLDDSITVHDNFTYFVVDAGKLYKLPYCSDEPKNLGLEKRKSFEHTVRGLRRQLNFLSRLCDTKHKLLHYSEVEELDAKIKQYIAQIEKLKQDLSNFCVSDCKNDILQSVGNFLHDKTHMDSGLVLWACKRLKDLLDSVTCSYLPDSIKMELESPGKVLIYIKEEAFGFGFGFAYVGMSWKFSGELPLQHRKRVSGSFQLAGFSNFDMDEFGFSSESAATLFGCKLTSRMRRFKCEVNMEMTRSVRKKFLEFQDEFKRKMK